MHVGSAAHEDEPACAINVAPLVDVMLVLLVVFMLTAHSVSTSSVAMDLPKARSASTASESPFVVSVTETGALVAEGIADGDEDALRTSARAALARSADARAIVRAAAGTDHGHVVHALDVLRTAGFARIALAAERAP